MSLLQIHRSMLVEITCFMIFYAKDGPLIDEDVMTPQPVLQSRLNTLVLSPYHLKQVLTI